MSDKGRLNEVETQLLNLGKEVDEIRRRYNRIGEMNRNSGLDDIGAIQVQLTGVTDIIDVLCELCQEKGLFTREEFRDRSEKLFDKRQGFEIINDRDRTSLEKDEFSMITFTCKDDEGRVLFREPEPTLYQVGVGKLPFESKIMSMRPGEKGSFSVQFPEGFNVKSVAGATVTVDLECHKWKRRVINVRQPIRPNQEADAPMTLNDEGDVSK